MSIGLSSLRHSPIVCLSEKCSLDCHLVVLSRSSSLSIIVTVLPICILLSDSLYKIFDMYCTATVRGTRVLQPVTVLSHKSHTSATRARVVLAACWKFFQTVHLTGKEGHRKGDRVRIKWSNVEMLKLHNVEMWIHNVEISPHFIHISSTI